MLRCRSSRTLLIFSLCAAALITGAAPAAVMAYGNKTATKEPPPPPPPFVIRFISGDKVRYYGPEALVITGVGALDGRQVKAAVRNSDQNKYTPNERFANEVKALKPGDYVKIEVEPKDNQVWVKNLTPYKVTPGEELPGNYVFVETYTKGENGQDHNFVTLNKFGSVIDSVIPLKRNDSKEMVADAGMVERVGKMKKGDIVEADLQAGRPFATLNSIDAYTTPQTAKMGKIGETEIDGQKYPTVDLDQDGKTLSLAVVGKLAGKKLTPDAKVLGNAKSMKAGADVLFRTREEGGRMWLKEIKLAPKQTPAAKPTAAAKDPKMEESKGK